MSANSFLDYNHNAVFMRAITGFIKNLLTFLALGYIKLIHWSANLYLTAIGLLFFSNIYTDNQIIRLIGMAAHLVYIYKISIPVVYYFEW